MSITLDCLCNYHIKFTLPLYSYYRPFTLVVLIIQTSATTNSIDKTESNINSKSNGNIVIRKLPLTVTQKVRGGGGRALHTVVTILYLIVQEVCALLDPYGCSVVTCSLVQEEDTITAHVQ